jgi:hypothetical protein
MVASIGRAVAADSTSRKGYRTSLACVSIRGVDTYSIVGIGYPSTYYHTFRRGHDYPRLMIITSASNADTYRITL